jgi:hypothetical protein
MDTEDGSGQIRRWHGSKANPEEQRKEVSRTMGYKIRLAAKWRKGTHGTQPVVIWPPTAFADGLCTPMIGIQRIAHDSDGCFCSQSWFHQQA